MYNLFCVLLYEESFIIEILIFILKFFQIYFFITIVIIFPLYYFKIHCYSDRHVLHLLLMLMQHMDLLVSNYCCVDLCISFQSGVLWHWPSNFLNRLLPLLTWFYQWGSYPQLSWNMTFCILISYYVWDSLILFVKGRIIGVLAQSLV
mgnify:CR=1 FL=1